MGPGPHLSAGLSPSPPSAKPCSATCHTLRATGPHNHGRKALKLWAEGAFILAFCLLPKLTGTIPATPASFWDTLVPAHGHHSSLPPHLSPRKPLGTHVAHAASSHPPELVPQPPSLALPNSALSLTSKSCGCRAGHEGRNGGPGAPHEEVAMVFVSSEDSPGLSWRRGPAAQIQAR